MSARARTGLRLAGMCSLILVFIRGFEGQDVKTEKAKDRHLTEPHLAIDPENANHWLAAAIVPSPDMSKTGCISLVSFDGGRAGHVMISICQIVVAIRG